MEQIIPSNIHPLSEREIEYFKQLTDTMDGWEESLQYSNVALNTRSYPGTNIRMLRASSEFVDITPNVVFDFLQDLVYRSRLNSATYNNQTLRYLNEHASIEYLCIECMFPLQDRDCVIQKTSIPTPDDYIIIYHSVEDELFGVNEDKVRAHTYLSGYRIRRSPNGTYLTFLSHSDPRGYVPSFICNYVIKRSVPSMVTAMYEASLGYLDWKQSTDNPLFMPWRVVEDRDKSLYASHESLLKWGFSSGSSPPESPNY